MEVPRVFSTEGASPFDLVEWDLRSAEIKDERGRMIFEQVDCEIPKSWSQLATNVVVSKYFYGDVSGGNGSPGEGKREYSVRQLVDRVTRTIADWGKADGYFATPEDADRFYDELTSLCLNQYGSFNSPVWFNVGLYHQYGVNGPANNWKWDEEARAVVRVNNAYETPQSSACFIQSVSDDMESIMKLAHSEAMLFKFGSGTGTDLSTLRSSREKLSGGGKPSGPVSFMRVYDAIASVVKSGGKTRRAAKMQTLKVWHPDILDFIECKIKEEAKAYALIREGYEANFNGEAYSSVLFQNSNLSVRCSDAFLKAAEADEDWTTRTVTTGRPSQTYKAKMLLDKIAEGTWLCGDPGMQYEDTIQRWHTCPNTAPINSSNPCVTGETLVSTAEGYRRIADLVGGEAILVDRHGVRRPIDRIFPTGRKPVYRLTTASGYQLRLTADHRVFTVNRGDVSACELTKDDRIALNPVGFGSDDLDVEMAEVIGLMLGDGCISRSPRDGEPITTLTMGSNLESSIVADVRDRLNRFKDGHADGRTRRSIEVGEGGIATVSRLSTGSKSVAQILERYAVLDRGSAGKQLTDAAFGLERAAVAGLLRGIFTADGCVYNYGTKSQSVSLDSVSLDLLRQVQLLLLGFGIKAKIYADRRVGPLVSVLPDGKGGVKEYPVQQVHSLRISRSSRVRFEKEIGFWAGSTKQAKLELLNQTVAAYADRMDDPVASIVYEGEEDVFDLTEPATSHFGANGLVVHNCSEYMFIDDSACNLSSLNLMKFVREDGAFDAEKFRAAVRIFITAQEILVDHASYPTEKIAGNSHKFRPLGLGYANLGSLLMSAGLPYDSTAGRSLAAAITAIMHGQAYLSSAEHAGNVGAFEGFAINREPMLKVMEMHRDAALAIDGSAPEDLRRVANEVWAECLERGRKHGYRNSQVTVLAPTGTIAFMMDCDTTGIEPDIALVKYKSLAGGGMLKIVNRTVPMALAKLGYDEPGMKRILDHIDAHDTIEGAPGLADEHLPVFDCAFAPPQGGRSIHFLGHIRMMAAVQPFLSGAISKTCNVPNEATVEDIRNAYLEGWRLGLKAIAIYRDGSKGSQPVNTKSDAKEEAKKEAVAAAAPAPVAAPAVVPAPAPTPAPAPAPHVVYQPRRERLPHTRKSVTHKFDIQGHEGYINVGFYPDGRPGELFITMAKEGSTIGGLMDVLGTSISIGLQYGVPLEVFVNKFAHSRFEPAGFTKNPDIPIAKSIADYIFRWMGMEFIPGYRAANAPQRPGDDHDHDHDRPAAEVKVNGHRTATIADLEHAEAVMGAKILQDPVPASAPPPAVVPLSVPEGLSEQDRQFAHFQSDAPACDNCGALTVRCGTCYRCFNCGNSMGCS
ncbi:LAGLIDADG family homing endonuclease [Aquisphaera insulae]|uniref:LAGLIDADG family homing endonuclease n=1 Tax=Aquisphaera insulae TaxID=2712864 RepID=UPI0013EB8AD5|nr:LAGLIDADG family homing endonuclease [Aquisphaera insulae]